MLSSSATGLEGDILGEGGGAGGVTPGIRNKGTGGAVEDEGIKRKAFRRHKEANSRDGTGMA